MIQLEMLRLSRQIRRGLEKWEAELISLFLSSGPDC